MNQIDAVVIGAGAVGLAISRALARSGRSVMILEQEAAIGTGISARNSEVIHAGIYYPSGSLKARLCVRGRQLLYAYCERRGVAHRRLGKLIVATEADQLDQLETIRAAALANGVNDLYAIEAGEARALEPALRCRGALVSPSTGIIDSHAYMLSLLGEAEDRGATLVLRTSVERIERREQHLALTMRGDAQSALAASVVINSAGLGAPALAARTVGLPTRNIPSSWLAKGNYFLLRGRSPFSRLIYPLPVPGGLGIHLTLDLGGGARFGPDVQWVEQIDYSVDAAQLTQVEASVRQYWPGMPEAALAPGYSGIRPKISGPGEPAADFQIEGMDAHGIPGLVNLFGIESPGLTSSLAIAEYVESLLA